MRSWTGMFFFNSRWHSAGVECFRSDAGETDERVMLVLQDADRLNAAAFPKIAQYITRMRDRHVFRSPFLTYGMAKIFMDARERNGPVHASPMDIDGDLAQGLATMRLETVQRQLDFSNA